VETYLVSCALVQHLEMRIKVLEEELRGGVDLDRFTAPPLKAKSRGGPYSFISRLGVMATLLGGGRRRSVPFADQPALLAGRGTGRQAARGTPSCLVAGQSE